MRVLAIGLKGSEVLDPGVLGAVVDDPDTAKADLPSGAFRRATPEDSVDDLVRILTEPESALTRQYAALLGADGVDLSFTPDGIAALAEIAEEVNRRTEDIGARRLHTILEKVLEEVSFEADALSGTRVVVDRAYVESRVRDLAADADLSRFIL